MSSLEVSDNSRSKVIGTQWITAIWICMQCLLSFLAGDKSSSMALLTFSGNSAAELALAVVVLLRLYGWRIRGRLVTRIAALFLVMLAPLTVVGVAVGVLIPGFEPKPSALGVAVLIVATLVMPWLNRARREIVHFIRSNTSDSDAAPNLTGAYLLPIALVGVAFSALFSWPWADSLAAMALLPFIFREAWQAWHEGEWFI